MHPSAKIFQNPAGLGEGAGFSVDGAAGSDDGVGADHHGIREAHGRVRGLQLRIALTEFPRRPAVGVFFDAGRLDAEGEAVLREEFPAARRGGGENQQNVSTLPRRSLGNRNRPGCWRSAGGRGAKSPGGC
mgnify:CR=1 FL=1